MKGLKGALMFAQSGGPTSVINSSAAGVFTEALKQDCITAVYGAAHGIRGILNEEFYDISKEDIKEFTVTADMVRKHFGKSAGSASKADDTEKVAENVVPKTEGAETKAEPPKKKKKIIFVSNPGNSKMPTNQRPPASSAMKQAAKPATKPAVKPAPKAANTRLSPFLSCFSHSYKQSGIVTDVVLPNFSMFIITFSFGSSMRSAVAEIIRRFA